MEVTWKDIENNIDDCVTICTKNESTIFRIMESRHSYYADYYDNSLFDSPHLLHSQASQMAKERFGEDSIENRLVIAKEFFLEDYKKQTTMKMRQLANMSI